MPKADAVKRIYVSLWVNGETLPEEQRARAICQGRRMASAADVPATGKRRSQLKSIQRSNSICRWQRSCQSPHLLRGGHFANNRLQLFPSSNTRSQLAHAQLTFFSKTRERAPDFDCCPPPYYRLPEPAKQCSHLRTRSPTSAAERDTCTRIPESDLSLRHVLP